VLDRPLVFLDIETTGATAHYDRITEIGLVEVCVLFTVVAIFAQFGQEPLTA